VFSLAPGILPGGLSHGLRRYFRVQSWHSARQTALLGGEAAGAVAATEPKMSSTSRQIRQQPATWKERCRARDWVGVDDE